MTNSQDSKFLLMCQSRTKNIYTLLHQHLLVLRLIAVPIRVRNTHRWGTCIETCAKCCNFFFTHVNAGLYLTFPLKVPIHPLIESITLKHRPIYLTCWKELQFKWLGIESYLLPQNISILRYQIFRIIEVICCNVEMLSYRWSLGSAPHLIPSKLSRMIE